MFFARSHFAAGRPCRDREVRPRAGFDRHHRQVYVEPKVSLCYSLTSSVVSMVTCLVQAPQLVSDVRAGAEDSPVMHPAVLGLCGGRPGVGLRHRRALLGIDHYGKSVDCLILRYAYRLQWNSDKRDMFIEICRKPSKILSCEFLAINKVT